MVFIFTERSLCLLPAGRFVHDFHEGIKKTQRNLSSSRQFDFVDHVSFCVRMASNPFRESLHKNNDDLLNSSSQGTSRHLQYNSFSIFKSPNYFHNCFSLHCVRRKIYSSQNELHQTETSLQYSLVSSGDHGWCGCYHSNFFD